MSQKIHLRPENEAGRIPDAACQDHMLGSGCQMRTLDSGIGTFPLPDSVTRAGGRHLPKSESSPGDLEPPSPRPDPSLPDVKVPSLPSAPPSMGHSLSDPSVTFRDAQSRLPTLAASDAIRLKRSSLGSTEDRETAAERTTRARGEDGERVLQVCSYSGSGSDTETEPERTGSSPQRTLVPRSKRRDSVAQNEETLKRSSVETSLSIMDYYQHEMYAHLEKDSRRISQYNLLHTEASLDGSAGDRLSVSTARRFTFTGCCSHRAAFWDYGV
ncbi:Nck-associated protein 5 [Liparis tanakae]|uniref:Nck-associated protein 5 n=1 Tax=Liparis tanakae TaxID=230148 RepID=A0A4Z2GBV9_9TELE|nr:Nck-associated protein 5 [Liparis tanakae]